MALANIEYVKGQFPNLPGRPEGPVDPGYGVEGPTHPMPPIHLPSLPGIWPPPGKPGLPIELPPNVAAPPIYIPEEPGHPLPLPPGTIWPPLPPDMGLDGKYAILVLVVGVGYRWLIYDSNAAPGHPLPPEPGTPGHPLPPVPQPKR